MGHKDGSRLSKSLFLSSCHSVLLCLCSWAQICVPNARSVPGTWHKSQSSVGLEPTVFLIPFLLYFVICSPLMPVRARHVFFFFLNNVIYFGHAWVLFSGKSIFGSPFRYLHLSSMFWVPNLRWMTNGISLPAMSLQQELSPANCLIFLTTLQYRKVMNY